MQSTSFLGASPSCCHPVPNFLFFNPRFKPKPVILSLAKAQTFSTETCFVPLISRNSCSEEREDKSKYHDRAFFRNSCSPIQRSESRGQREDIQNQEQDQDPRQGPGATRKARKRNRGIFTSMWWADLKAAFGQRINFEGIICSAAVLARDRHLLLPHIRVPDIRYIDWAELKRRGFEGVVFDKDNTITAPYSLKLWGPTASSVERCKSIFGHNIAVFSNSAGLLEYDHNGSKAKALEWAIGIKVIRHRVKKPAGTAEEIENHFGCDSSRLIMVGDRPFTDIVYGNRNGFLTILTQPLNLTEEPFIVRQVRKLETVLVDSWLRRGLKPTCHRLLSDGIQCVKDPSFSRERFHWIERFEMQLCLEFLMEFKHFDGTRYLSSFTKQMRDFHHEKQRPFTQLFIWLPLPAVAWINVAQFLIFISNVGFGESCITSIEE